MAKFHRLHVYLDRFITPIAYHEGYNLSQKYEPAYALPCVSTSSETGF
jgi:hypothetical protein